MAPQPLQYCIRVCEIRRADRAMFGSITYHNISTALIGGHRAPIGPPCIQSFALEQRRLAGCRSTLLPTFPIQLTRQTCSPVIAEQARTQDRAGLSTQRVE